MAYQHTNSRGKTFTLHRTVAKVRGSERTLHSLARALPVRSVEPVTVTWERTAPLSDVERSYLHQTFAWLVEDDARRWVGRSWDACRRLFDPASEECLVDRPDLHVVQTAAAVVITV